MKISNVAPLFYLAASAWTAGAAKPSATPFIVFTPAALVTCQPALISWTGGQAPYYLEVLPGGQVGAAALESFPTVTGHSFVWLEVDIPAETSM